ncbi:MAG: hypothetical protein J5590_09815 [Clostridia bacterium]|nr:hypothetical protein [Clostridia bacterium]
MNKQIGKIDKKLMSVLAMLLCVLMVMACMPSNLTAVSADEYYYDTLNTFYFSKYNHGYYFAPKAPGKYPVIIYFHGQGGFKNVKPHLLAFMNEWVKAGWFEPAIVVMPEIDHEDDLSVQRSSIDFQEYIRRDERFTVLLNSLLDGSFSDKIDTSRDIWVAGSSAGGMTAIYAGTKYNDIFKKVGCLSPSQAYYLGEGKWGVYNHASDIYLSQDPDAKLYMAYGEAERSAGTNVFKEAILRYKDAVESTGNNKEDLITLFAAPEEWGGHGWPLFEKEVFMWLYLNTYGALPDRELVESVCKYRVPREPEVIDEELNLDDIALPEALIDLDYSGYKKDAETNPMAVEGSIGGVVNCGTHGENTKVVMSDYDASCDQSLDLERLQNGEGDITHCLEFTKNTAFVQTSNNSRYIEDSILETQDNTISFWAKVTPGRERRSILNYRVTYDGAGTNEIRLCTDTGSDYYICDGWEAFRQYINENNGKWALYTIKNPAYVDGKKTVSVYVNGWFIYEKEITQPEGELESARLYFAGEGDGNHAIYYPDSFGLGGVTVYDGILDDHQIYKAFEEGEGKYKNAEVLEPGDDPEPVEEPEPFESTALIDLDMSTYIKDTSSVDPKNVEGSIGCIVNSGTLSDTTVVKMSSQSGRWTSLDLSLESFVNIEGTETSYLHRTISTNLCNDNNRFNTVEDIALEEGANTISFWAKYVPENRADTEYNILDYNVTYDSESTHLFTLDQAPAASGAFKISGRWQSPRFGDITDEAAGKWAQYVITNPEYVNGKKTMKVYVNGQYKGEQTVTQPVGNLTGAKLLFGGEASPTSWVFWPTEYNLGDIKVYEGELSDINITSLYNESKNKYIEDETAQKTIIGYTFEDAEAEFDGENHTIEITAASNATPGVFVVYTVDDEEFTGASEEGTYEVTAKITKEGYNDLVLTAVLRITPKQEDPEEIEEFDGTALIDLDMSTYVKDSSAADPKNIEGSIGSIENSGTLSDTTVIKMSSQSGRWTDLDLSIESFVNAEGTETSYLHRTISSNLCNDNNRFNTIEDTALEEGGNTISFWVKYMPENRVNTEYGILDYNVTYDGVQTHLFTLDQAPSAIGAFRLSGRWQSPVFGVVTDEAAGKWAHYVITNPAYVDGMKEMKVYVNGIYLGSKTVCRPNGNLTNVKLAFGGEASPTSCIFWPTEFNLGEIKVFDGELSEKDIRCVYMQSKNKYTEVLD